MSDQPSSGRRASYQRSASGLVGAIVVALLAIAFVWGLTRFQHRDVPDPVKTVDYSATLAEARRVAPFEILAPDPAPDGWRATSVSWDGVAPEVSWHLGFLTSSEDDADYVGLEQSNAETGQFVAQETPADQPGGSVEIGGETWQTLTSSDGDETALVLYGDEVTTIVTGTAPEDELVAFAGSLSPS